MPASPPSRKSSARSSRICGSGGASPSTPGGNTRGGRKRTKCSAGAAPRRALAHRADWPAGRPETPRPRSCRRTPCRRCARPASARRRCTAAIRCRPWRSASRVARSAASASTPTSAPASEARPMARSVMTRRIASRRSWLEEWRWSALVAANSSWSMRAHEQRAQPVVGAGAEDAQDRLERTLQVDDGVAALVERAEHVDEHDLPVEPAEVVAKERPHDVRLVALEAPRHHGGERGARVARRRRRARAGRR